MLHGVLHAGACVLNVSRLGLCGPPGGVANLVARAMLEATPHAMLALQNAGGCRSDIAAGVFTMADAYELLPFGETLVLLRPSRLTASLALQLPVMPPPPAPVSRLTSQLPHTLVSFPKPSSVSPTLGRTQCAGLSANESILSRPRRLPA